MRRTRNLLWLPAWIGILVWLGASTSLLAAGAVGASLSPQQVRQTLADGLDHFYNLEYDAAIRDFQKLQADDPTNPTWQNHLAVSYLHKQLFIAGALDGNLFGASNQFFRSKKIVPDPVLENLFQQANQAAVVLCERRLEENAKDEEALYACGVAYAARAMYSGLIDRAALETLGNARRSNNYHMRVMHADPSNYDAYLIPGFYEFVVGSLPGPMKVLVFFAGLTGDKQHGIGMVEDAARWGDGARRDAQVLLAVMYRRESRYAEARRTVEDLAQAFPRNYIFPLEIASLRRSAQEYPEAIQQYETILAKASSGLPNYTQASVARIHFELANLYEMTGKPEIALQQLRQVPGSRGGNEDLEKQAATLEQQVEAELAAKKPAP